MVEPKDAVGAATLKISTVAPSSFDVPERTVPAVISPLIFALIVGGSKMQETEEVAAADSQLKFDWAVMLILSALNKGLTPIKA